MAGSTQIFSKVFARKKDMQKLTVIIKERSIAIIFVCCNYLTENLREGLDQF